MPSLRLNAVSVRFPLYDAWHRSLLGRFALFGTLPGPLEGYRRPYTQALQDLQLELKPGMRLAVLGPNNSGKTTLLRVLAGLLEPTSGEVVIDGTPAAVLNLGFGFDPQFTVAETIMFTGLMNGLNRKEILSRMDNLLTFCGLCELQNFQILPIASLTRTDTVLLATGIGLYLGADILVLDEVLDQMGTQFLDDLYLCLSKAPWSRRIFVMAGNSHAHAERFCTHVLRMENGSIVDFGPLERVLAQDAHHHSG